MGRLSKVRSSRQDRLLSPKTDCLMSIHDQPRTVDPDTEVVSYDFIRMPNNRLPFAIDRSTTMGRRKIRSFSSSDALIQTFSHLFWLVLLRSKWGDKISLKLRQLDWLLDFWEKKFSSAAWRITVLSLALKSSQFAWMDPNTIKTIKPTILQLDKLIALVGLLFNDFDNDFRPIYLMIIAN